MLRRFPTSSTLPGSPPYVRGAEAAGYLAAPWLVAQEIRVGLPAAFNEALRHDLARGQTAVNLVVDAPTRAGLDPDQAPAEQIGVGGLSLATADDLATALDGLDLAATPILIQAGASALALGALMSAAIRRLGFEPSQLSGCVGSDPLGELMRDGQLPCSLTQAYDEMAELTAWTQANAPALDTLVVDGSPIHEGGGSAVQELAYALAIGVDYLRAMSARGLDVDVVAPRLRFVFAVGGNFFMEVAKLRAARLLWSQIVDAFGGNDEAQKMTIHAHTARWNKTTVDPYVNMLRVTTEAFAGAVGGVGSMAVAPFDDVVRPADEFARRIARNTQLVLQSETNVARVIDPAGGSWYVEQLTDQLARQAWSAFQAIEENGGMLAALEAGTPQSQIAETAAMRDTNLETRRDVLVGTNMYADLTETALEAGSLDSEVKAFAAQRQAQIAEVRSASQALAFTAPADAEPGTLLAEAIVAAAAGATLGQNQPCPPRGGGKWRVAIRNAGRTATHRRVIRRTARGRRWLRRAHRLCAQGLSGQHGTAGPAQGPRRLHDRLPGRRRLRVRLAARLRHAGGRGRCRAGCRRRSCGHLLDRRHLPRDRAGAGGSHQGEQAGDDGAACRVSARAGGGVQGRRRQRVHSCSGQLL